MKQNCLISRLDEPNIAHLYVIEWDQNLINNIRVLCTRNPETVKYFVPQELFWKLKNGEAVSMTAECYDEDGTWLFTVDPLKVLSEQAGAEDGNPAGVSGLEIRLRVDGYAPAQPSEEMRGEVLARPARYKIRSEAEARGSRAGGAGGAGYRGGSAGNRSGYAGGTGYQGRSAGGTGCRGAAGSRAGAGHQGGSAGGTSFGSGTGQDEDVTFRRRKRFPIKEIILAALIVAAAAGVWFMRDTSVKRLGERLEAADYKEAVAIYNEEIRGHEAREEKADPQVREAVEDVRDRYMDESCGYEDACAYLNILAGIEKEELSQLAQSALDEVELYEASSATIREGIALMEEEAYLKAIEVLLRVEESSAMYDQARENIDNCVGMLIKAGAEAKSEEECLEAIAGMDEGLALLPENGELMEGRADCLSKYQSLVRAGAIAEADELAAKGDYAGAFERLNAGLEVLVEDEQLREKAAALQKDFVDHITRQALGRVIDGDFEEAEELVEDSLGIYSCGELDDLLDQIAESGKWSAPATLKYRAGEITYTEYPGEFKGKTKKNEYTVKAAQSGGCVWEFTRMESALKVQFVVKGPDGAVVVREKGLADGSKVYCDLEKDRKYTVEVTASEGEGGYVLLLGQNKAAVDISAYDSVTDSLKYKGQSNEYTYVPEVTGTYRFDVDCGDADLPVKLEVFDHRNSKAGGGEMKDGDGFTADMTAGGKYRIEVSGSGKAAEEASGSGKAAEEASGSGKAAEEASGSGKIVEYTFSIGKPEVSEDVTGRYIICGAVTYPGQKKSYTFKAEQSGQYRITVGNMGSGSRVKMFLYSSLGDKIGGSDELGNGDSVTAELTEGQGYQLQLTQSSGTGGYTITVARE